MDLPNLVDPATHKELSIDESGLTLRSECSSFPFIKGIPRFFSGELYTANFGEQWTSYNEDQYDGREGDYEGLDITFDVIQEVFPHPLALLKGHSILEAGCGNGRMTSIFLKQGALVDAFDASSAIDVAKKNLCIDNINPSSYRLAQASILEMPYQKLAYDYVVCLHVLQHTPSPEKSIDHLWSRVAPGGYLVIDHYRLKLKSMYPPIGGFGNLFRRLVLLIPRKYQKKVSDSFVNFWFPVHWFFKDNKLMQQILMRMTPVRFYYPWLGLPSKEAYLRKALCDTYDGSADRYHHFRTCRQIEQKLMSLPFIESFSVRPGGNGVLAYAKKLN